MGFWFTLAVSGLSVAWDSVNPMPELGGSMKCTVSSSHADNIGVCVKMFGGDHCVSGGLGTMDPRCNGTIQPL